MRMTAIIATAPLADRIRCPESFDSHQTARMTAVLSQPLPLGYSRVWNMSSSPVTTMARPSTAITSSTSAPPLIEA